LTRAIPPHDFFQDVFRMIGPKALDVAFGKVMANVAALLKDGDVIAMDGKARIMDAHAGDVANHAARSSGHRERPTLAVGRFLLQGRRAQPEG